LRIGAVNWDHTALEDKVKHVERFRLLFLGESRVEPLLGLNDARRIILIGLVSRLFIFSLFSGISIFVSVSNFRSRVDYGSVGDKIEQVVDKLFDGVLTEV
jgi:hypothetical protein